MNWIADIKAEPETRTIPIVWVHHAWVFDLGKAPDSDRPLTPGAVLKVTHSTTAENLRGEAPALCRLLRPDTVRDRGHRTLRRPGCPLPRVHILSNRIRQNFN